MRGIAQRDKFVERVLDHVCVCRYIDRYPTTEAHWEAHRTFSSTLTYASKRRTAREIIVKGRGLINFGSGNSAGVSEASRDYATNCPEYGICSNPPSMMRSRRTAHAPKTA